MEFKGQLVVKLSKERALALVTSGQATVFDPSHGRPLKQFSPAKERWKGQRIFYSIDV
jgi:hypothetical protein